MENFVNFYFMEKNFILKPRGHMENLEILKKIRHIRIFRPVLDIAGAWNFGKMFIKIRIKNPKISTSNSKNIRRYGVYKNTEKKIFFNLRCILMLLNKRLNILFLDENKKKSRNFDEYFRRYGGFDFGKKTKNFVNFGYFCMKI